MRPDSFDMTRPSRAEIKAQTRQSLLDAGREVFLSVGYQGATLDQIAAKAGYTKGALYWHFPNKQAIFLALIADAIEETLAKLDKLLDVEPASPEHIKAHLGRWIDAIDDREPLPAFGVELEIEARRDPSFRQLHQSLIGKHETAIAEFLGRYFTLVGETPPMPLDEMASCIITVLKGFALVRQNRPYSAYGSATILRLMVGLPTR